MSKKRKYRIVTNGEFFRIQKQKKFIGIKWWKFDEINTLFNSFSNAQQLMKNYENGDRCFEEMQLNQKKARKMARKKARKNPWKPVENERRIFLYSKEN